MKNIPEGDIQARSDRLITKIFIDNLPIFLGMASKFTRNDQSERMDAIQSFFEKKICGKTPDQLTIIIDRSPGFIMKMFKHHLIDRYRTNKRIQEKFDIIIEAEKKKGIYTSPSTIDESITKIKYYKNQIHQEFSEEYALIFELKANEFSNKEIASKTNKTPNAIGVIIHRIRTFLKNNAASF